jgi:hypothetical protein
MDLLLVFRDRWFFAFTLRARAPSRANTPASSLTRERARVFTFGPSTLDDFLTGYVAGGGIEYPSPPT